MVARRHVHRQIALTCSGSRFHPYRSRASEALQHPCLARCSTYPQVGTYNSDFDAALGNLRSFAIHPMDLLTLQRIRKSDGSRESLLQSDVTNPAQSAVHGVPFVSSAAVTRGTCWGLSPAHVLLVVREDNTVEADYSVAWTSDRVALKSRLRVNVLHSLPRTLVRVRFAAS